MAASEAALTQILSQLQAIQIAQQTMQAKVRTIHYSTKDIPELKSENTMHEIYS